MALLRPGRWGSRPQGGCLQHRTEAQRRPKGQDAGGTPALPGDAVPAVRWGVSGGRLLRKPTCTLWETPVCPRALPRRTVRIKPECNNQKSIIPSRPWHPVVVNLSALVALRRSSWPFVDKSFSFVFFRLFQTSGAPALPGRSSEGETGLFQTSRAPALPCGSYEGETGVIQARCQFLSNPCCFTLLNWFCVTRTPVCFR